MFESMFIIFCCVSVCAVFIYLFINEEKLRKEANQPTLSELNKIYKKEVKQKKLGTTHHQSKKVWDNIPLVMDKEEFFKIQ